ncbi:hypothetical protein [Yinghuangia sp. YIM S09857]|uniref:hypothetical protein n=1 Tax=Yinghuangia sp. YIM S09857 TaxID=3436929 RepID=UPI003F52A8E9
MATVGVLPAAAAAAAASADDGDTDGVTVWRAPGRVETVTGDVRIVRDCVDGALAPQLGVVCRYVVVV